jgi:Uma2 family endonuclease
MATTATISVEEYLHSTYEPDMEYIDGQLEERNVGEIEHSDVVMAILGWFQQHAKEWQIRVRPDVRTQVGISRFRVPDIALCTRASKDKRIVREAPLVVIEVLSPEDRINRYHQRIADYRAMGIKGIWVIDPEDRCGWDCSSGNWIETTDFRLDPVYMNLTEILAELEA